MSEQASAPASPESPQVDYGDAVKIGLWGPPQSGKTTYLAALTAATLNDTSWNIWPLSAPAMELKDRFEKALIEDLQFPEGTALGATVPLEWLFVGDLSGSQWDQRRMGRRRRMLESRFVLDLIDVHGSAYRREPDLEAADAAQEPVRKEIADRVFEHLADSKGIIFLFDPIGEKKNRNSATYMRGAMNELLMRSARRGRPGNFLDQQISVCITKWDHPKLFEQARTMNIFTKDPVSGMPVVRDSDAEMFFDELCSGRFWNERPEGGLQSAQFVRKTIKSRFDPQKVRYFVTSSIGFSMEPPLGERTAPKFDFDGFPNYTVLPDGTSRIKGEVRPINVLEPLISLQQRIAGG